MIGVLLHLFHQSLYLAGLRNVGGYGVGLALAGKGIEGGDGFFAGFGLARGDEDLRDAGLGEAGIEWISCWCVVMYRVNRTQTQRAVPTLSIRQ